MKYGYQKKLAEYSGVNPSTLNRILKQGQRPSFEVAKKLSELFPGTTPGFWIDADLITLKRMFEEWEPRPETR